jgi:Protein of unknown function (DUF1566)
VKKGRKPVIWVGALLLAACGAGGVAGAPTGDPAQSPVARCTGPVPPHAIMCPGADAGLTSDTPRVVTGSVCAATPCAYVCDVGYLLGSDGACAVEPSGPPPVLTDHGDGTVTVTDAFGQTTWLKNAGCADTVGGVAPASGVSWPDAMAWSQALASGACGLSDGSHAGDWRLPDKVDLLRLQVDLASGNPFINIQPGPYWSSWTYWTDKADAVDMFTGEYFEDPKTNLFYVWPFHD